MAATGNKKTHEGIPHPAKPKKKKQKLDSALVRFLETLAIIDTPLLSRIIELDNSNNDSDYIITVTHAWEKPTLRPAITTIEPQSSNHPIIKMKLYQQDRLYNIKVLLDNGNNIPLFFLSRAYK